MIIIIFTQKARWARGFHADTFCSIKLPCISALTFKFKCLFFVNEWNVMYLLFLKKRIDFRNSTYLVKSYMNMEIFMRTRKINRLGHQFWVYLGSYISETKTCSNCEHFLASQISKTICVENSCSSATFHEIDFFLKDIVFHYCLKP